MRWLIVVLLGSLLAGGCYSFGARDSVPMVVITYTNGGVISVDDRTEVHGDGRVYTWHRTLWGRPIARRSVLSSRSTRELREILDGPAFAATAESLASLARYCGTMEEDTVSIRYFPEGAAAVIGFCVNDRDISPQLLEFLDRLEAPLIRELGERYTTRAGAHVRVVNGG